MNDNRTHQVSIAYPILEQYMPRLSVVLEISEWKTTIGRTCKILQCELLVHFSGRSGR